MVHPGPPGGYGPWHAPQQQGRFAAEGARRAASASQPSQGAKDDKTSPFVSTVHSHPGFQPQKIGKGAGVVSIICITICYCIQNTLYINTKSHKYQKLS